MAELITVERASQAIRNFNQDDVNVLTNILKACSAFVERYCHRTFASNTYDELYNGTEDHNLLLNNFPVTAVARVATGLETVLTVTNSNENNSVARVAVTATGLTLTSMLNGTLTNTTLTFASYPTLSAMATAINLIAGWEATALKPGWVSSDIKLQGAYSALLTTAGLKVHTREVSYFELREDIGELFLPSRWQRGYKNYRVTYTAGHDATPEPIAQATAELCAAVYASRNVNPNIQSESLGSYSYTLAAGNSFDRLSVPSKQALSLYRNNRVARFQAY